MEMDHITKTPPKAERIQSIISVLFCQYGHCSKEVADEVLALMKHLTIRYLHAISYSIALAYTVGNLVLRRHASGICHVMRGV